MKIRKVNLSVGDVLIVADSTNKTVYRLMLKNHKQYTQDIELVVDACNSDCGYSSRLSDIQIIDDLIQNSADSRRSPVNAAVLADISCEFSVNVESVYSPFRYLSAGQGGNLFKLSEFKTGLYAYWRRCVDNLALPPFGRMAFDIYLSIDNPKFSSGLAFRNKYEGAPARYLWG